MVSTSFSTLVALTVLLAAQSPSPSSATTAPRVDPGVHRALRRQGTVNLMVTLKQGTETPLNAVQEASFDSRGAKIQALVEKLQKHATTSQSDITKVLFQEAATSGTPLFSKVASLWISNELYFENASIELVEKLASLSSVGGIREEEQFTVTADDGAGVQATANTTASVEWGVSIIKATDVWALGNTGQGIVVGGIDTGVRATHEILRDNFRSSYGWFDGTAGQPTPYDDEGHGTHTLGTAVGANGVGVAPGAKWIGCRGCNTDFCQESWLKACMQFMTCPTDPSGQNKDCSKAPHVVNNSWGGSSSNAFEAPLKAWIAAGIIPVFSAGNSGMYGCSTVDGPGDSPNAIGVGATTITDGLGALSSKGPTKDNRVKPDLTAPGINVRSANYLSDTAYKTVQGTSHAAPHVVGVVALMLSANPNLSFDQVRSILGETADRTPKLLASGYTCGGTPDTTYPNNQYGYGRVNALEAVRKASAQ